MVKQTLPCAEKNCQSTMTLIQNSENILGYSCLEKPDEHNFRFNMTHKKWEKIIIKTKLVIHYNEDPCEEFLIEPLNVSYEIEKTLFDTIAESHRTSELTEIKGIGSKRALELEDAGITTISDLAKRSPQHLAEKTGIPITQISNWIIEANKLTKRTIKITA